MSDRLPMDIKQADGDLVIESINREQYHDVEAVGEVGGHEILLHARVTDGTVTGGNQPKLTIHSGGEWTGETYLDGASITKTFESVWALDRTVGELLRKHGLEQVGGVGD